MDFTIINHNEIGIVLIKLGETLSFGGRETFSPPEILLCYRIPPGEILYRNRITGGRLLRETESPGETFKGGDLVTLHRLI
jgi:hypothetical protein